MVKQIVTSPIMLRMPSEPATKADADVAQDLLDTFAAHAHDCVGMAANMIGARKRIIVTECDNATLLMYNPEILSCKDPYQAKEACLSLSGERETTRYRTVEVSYLDRNFHPCQRTFTGFTAQIIQHQIDHCNGVVI